MQDKFHFITIKLVPDLENKLPDNFDSLSLFFQAGFKLNIDRVVGPLDNNTKKDKSLGNLWHDIEPSKNGFIVDIATELPYYLPDLDGKAEYSIKVGDKNFFVCNRMVKAFYKKENLKGNNGDYVLLHRFGLDNLKKNKNFNHIHALPLKSFIGSRFIFEGRTAEEVIENFFIKSRNDFLNQITNIVNTFRFVNPTKSKYLFPYPAIASYPIFWVVIEGKEGKKGCEQFTGDIRSVANRAFEEFDNNEVQELVINLEKRHNDSNIGLSLAFYHYGHYEQALIHLCTAIETILFRGLKQYLISKNLSKEQMEKALDDVSFSQLLNLHIFSVCSLDKLDNYKDLIGMVNWARKRRNEIVHKGQPDKPLDKENVKKAIEAGDSLSSFIFKELKNIEYNKVNSADAKSCAAD